nr:hypothetical protein [Tanacetum cinerariifolium]
VYNPDNVDNNMINQGMQMMPSSEQSNVVNQSKTEITSDRNIIPYSQYVIESQQADVKNSKTSTQQDALILYGRQISFASGTSRTYTPVTSRSNSGKQKTVIFYNRKGQGHMSKQCTKPKRKRDDSWFKDKVLLVQAQENGQILHVEELAFLADPGIVEVAVMANLSDYGSDALAEVYNPDNVDNNMINQGMQMMPSSEQSNVVNQSKTEITSDRNIIPYSQYVIESQQADVKNS